LWRFSANDTTTTNKIFQYETEKFLYLGCSYRNCCRWTDGVRMKDLFGAIFFVSVGMMVDVALIAEYIVPILCIVVAIMLGQTILSTCGFLLAGQSLKTAMQCSFSLTQIGEFAFILATLGTSLGVTSDFLYPIVVAVSVFTTFTTPYMIRLAEPAYAVVERLMPPRWRSKLQDYAESSNNETPESGEQQSHWKAYLKSVAVTVGIHCVLCMAIIALVLYFGKPYISSLMPAPWDGIVTALITLILVAPFLWMLMRQGNSDDARALWSDNRFSQAKLVALQFLRLFIAAAFVSYILGRTIHWGYTPSILIVIAIIFSIVFSPRLRKRSEQINQTFTENLAHRKE